jgi:hypothetical protein
MKTFETPSFKMHVHDDLLIEFIVKKDIKLQESDIWESKQLSLDYLPGKRFFVLMESEGYMDASADDLKAGASEEYSHHVKAVAKYSRKLHESILCKLYLQISKPFVPTKFFDNREKALAWLREQQSR